MDAVVGKKSTRISSPQTPRNRHTIERFLQEGYAIIPKPLIPAAMGNWMSYRQELRI
jgi:hypothetical protein